VEGVMALISFSKAKTEDLPPDTFDVRGWEVRTELDRESVGKVDDMLIDRGGAPRYLDIDMGMMKKHVLLPLGRAHVDGNDEIIWVDGLRKEHFDTIPEYSHDVESLTPAYERRLLDEYQGAYVRTRDDLPARSRGTQEYVGESTLSRLEDLDEYRVAKGDSDPRGWDVISGDGTTIGEVNELLVDTASLRARYIDCDVKEDDLDLEQVDRHVLIPVGQARLDRDRKKVIVDAMFASDLGRYPVYGGLPLGADIERKLDEFFDREPVWGAQDVDRFFGPRRIARDSEVRGRDDDIVTDRAITDRDLVTEEHAPVDEDRRVLADDRTVVRNTGDGATVIRGGDDVRIRLSGDDIIIERRPRG
jgi:hypothetical protein